MNSKQSRRTVAAENQAARAERGDAGQLQRLAASGHGHCREAVKLARKISKARKPSQYTFTAWAKILTVAQAITRAQAQTEKGTE